jgi:Aldehyde dehydrogenase family
VILKPAEEAPLTSLRLAELVMEAGIPPGVVNVAPGFGETAGAALASHPGVEKVAFTGSHTTGQSIIRASAGIRTPICRSWKAQIGISFDCPRSAARSFRRYRSLDSANSSTRVSPTASRLST